MCCFSRPVESVEATRIFARSEAGGRQLIVYSMKLRAREELAMILPLPVRAGAGEGGAKFIDLSGYPEFFADLEKGFPQRLAVPAASTRGLGGAGPKPLEVVSVGSFDASFVPTVKDFDRLDQRFRLPTGTWEKLPGYADHGFAVFKLKAGDAKVHPMAFSFPKAKPERLFFPTVHIHDGKVHDNARFDHILFCQRAAMDDFNLLDWEESIRPAAAFVQLSKAKDLILGDEHCYRKRMEGTLPNKDVYLSS